MKKSAADLRRGKEGTAVSSKYSKINCARIHPIIIYPYYPPGDYTDLKELYRYVAVLDSDKERFARPITVMDRKTHYALEKTKCFLDFRRCAVSRHSDILDAWCVDTCQMWYSGLGLAFERGAPRDIYWLIPGDFNYGTSVGKSILQYLHDLPEIILELDQDICIGEIVTDHNHPKQLIDTYGTFALLYNWFPNEAKEIRQFTERPRSEFIAICHNFLRHVLLQRWYAYEQTVIMLLQAVLNNKRISRFMVGELSDLPEGRESLASAMVQVERTERVLKSFWLELHHHKSGWIEQYRRLEKQSEQVRRSAHIVLQNLLSPLGQKLAFSEVFPPLK